MTQAVIDFFATFQYPRLAIFIISMLPIFELRLGLIAAKAFGVPLAQAAPICFIGNVLPLPFILLTIRAVLARLKRFRLTRRLAEWIERKGAKGGQNFKRGEVLGLFAFVALPLPGTGGWTGSLIAALLNMPLKRALPPVIGGVATAGVIMVTLTYFIPGLFGF